MLLAFFGLSACVAQQGAPGYGGVPMASVPAGYTAPTGRRIALLLPLSGTNASLGQAMLQAARLAFEPGPANAFDTQDTRSTSQGAVTAANAAIAAGAGLIVGPLTAPETTAITPVASARNVAVLALTSDSSKGRPGVWPLGLTPAQQVRSLVRGSLYDNKRRIGAILPANSFGDSLAAGLAASVAEAGLPPPIVLRYQSQSALEGAIKQLGTTGGAPGAPPAIDALLLGTTADVTLRILPALTAAGLGTDRVRILGTALWSRDVARLAPLAGAWFAGPPLTALRVFENNFIAHYGIPPRDIASVAFDAAAAARASVGPSGLDIATLLNPAGFAGANGVFRLLPDGTVRRSLALYEIGPSGARMLDAPPESSTSPSM